MKNNYILIFITTLLFLAGCSSSSLKNTENKNVTPPISSSDYLDDMEKFTQTDKSYSGFYNTYQVSVTMMNSLIESNVIQQKGYYFQWDNSKTQLAREKMFQEHSAKSKYVLAFYTPERKNNNLDKGDTIWKVYLHSNGQRYLGKVKKKKIIYSQFVELFPHYNRWNKAYDVYFDVPMNDVELSESKIVITSSFGQSEFKFSSVRKPKD